MAVDSDRMRLPMLCVLCMLCWVLSGGNALVSTRTSSQTILVTGGAGFVGSHVADVLLERGDRVVIIDEMNEYYNVSMKQHNLLLLQQKYPSPDQLQIYRGDICNTTLMTDIFQQHSDISMICHMAARAGVRPSIQDPFVYIHSNILGTVTLLHFAVQYNISNFVFASSSSVYGGSLSTFFSEDEPVDHPISPYAATKKACELFAYVYSYLYNLNVTALRFFTVYGPRGRPDMAPYKFIQRISRQLPIQQFGDGTSSRDYTYISDIVQGIVHSLDRPTPYAVYNLGKGSGTALNDFMALVEKYVGRKARIEYLPDQPGDVPYTCANISKARQFIDYVPNVLFEDGIQKTVEWYKEIDPSSAVESSLVLNQSKRIRHRQLLESSQELDTFSFVDYDDEMMLPETMISSAQSRRQLGEGTSDPSLTGHSGIKKVLVCSGGTFLANHLVEALLARGDDVLVLDFGKHAVTPVPVSTDSLFSRGKASAYLFDSYNTDLESMLQDERPEWIIHLGVEPDNASDQFLASQQYIQSNIDAMVRLLEYSQKNRVQNFLLTTSDAVYGASTPSIGMQIRREDDRVDYPKSAYGASMKSAELLAYTYHHLYHIPISILRLFPIFGTHYAADSAPFRIIDRIVSSSLSETEKVNAIGNMSSIDLTHVDDVVQGLLLALDRPQEGYEIFNLGSGNCDIDHIRTFIRLAVTMSLEHHDAVVPKDNLDRIVVAVETAWLASANVTDGISCADIQKAQERFGYRPRHSDPSMWESSIQEAIQYHLQTFVPSSASDLRVSIPESSPKLNAASEAFHEAAAQVPLSEKEGEMEAGAPSFSALASSNETGVLCGIQMVVPASRTFSKWLRRFAFVQWVLILVLLTIRLFYKTPVGILGGRSYLHPPPSRPPSPPGSPLDKL
jgi:UDP-glucuronate 4-epimerase